MELLFIAMLAAVVVAVGNLISWSVICLLFLDPDEKGE